MFCSVCKEAAAVDATISHKNGFMKEVLYEVRCLKSKQRSWVRIPLSHLNFSGS